MAFEKAAFTGLGIAFAGILTFGGIQGKTMRDTIDKSKHQIEQSGGNQKQIQIIEQTIGKPDMIDNILGQPLSEASKGQEWEKMAQYYENVAHSNKVKIKNLNIKQIAEQVTKTVKPLIR